jgi:KDO2-lipid IV(A) lauroyltransferase
MGRTGEYVAGALLALTAALPLRLARALGCCIGLLAWWRQGRSAQVTRCNLEHCFRGVSPRERERLARASLLQTGAAIAELGLAWHGSRAAILRAITATHGIPAVSAAHGRGLLVLAPHIGNWEVLLQFLQGLGQCTVLYRPPRQRVLGTLALAGRTRHGLRAVPASTAGVRELLRSLQRGETVVVLPDQEPARGSGRFAAFLGEPAWTSVLPHALTQRTGCAVRLGCCLRTEQGFEIRFDALEPAFLGEDVDIALAAMNRAIEGVVRQAPAQYQWEYKRFRTRPSGLVKLY